MTTTIASDSSDQAASTFGWDTVYAIRTADVNDAIVKTASSPKSFDYEQDGVKISGSFGPWKLTRGGDGSNLHFELPLLTATVADEDGSTSFQQCSAVVELQAQFLPHTDTQPAPNQGQLHKLVIQTEKANGEPAAIVKRVDFADPKQAASDEAAFLSAGLGDWLNANLGQFTHIFAVINLNQRVASGQFQFLKPTYCSYAYADHPSEPDGVLGILSMTLGHSAANLPAQLTSFAIHDGSRAGFLISRNLFLQELVLPSMTNLFPGSTADQFVMSASGDEIQAVDGVSFTFTSDGKNYTASIEELHVTTTEEELTIRCVTSTELSPGITAYCDNTSYHHIKLVNRADKTQTLDYEQSRPDQTYHHTEVSEGVKIAEDLEMVAGVILTVIVGVCTSGAAAVAGALVMGLLTGAAQSAPEIIEAAGQDRAPAISMLALNSTDPIVWSGSAAFQLDYAGLNESLQLGGTPHYDTAAQ